MSILNVYFHKDFDGFVAAALFLRINDETQLVGADGYSLHSVDYNIKTSWLKTELPKPNIVIDFLFHPKAQWWFDHHVTTFLNEKHKLKYSNTEKQFWDIKSPSCAALIRDNLQSHCSLFLSGDDYSKIMNNFSEWIYWSDIIDNAKFESPAQVVELKHPCLQINETLTGDIEDEYIRHLVTAAKMYLPEEVAGSYMVKTKIDNALKSQDKYLHIFKNGYKILPNEIVFFDYVKNDMPFQRYMTYYYEPGAYYSIGLYKRDGKYSISIGKNPWLDIPSKNIGEICRKFGGGGRINVGSFAVPDYSKAIEYIDTISKDLSI
jgi:hypothetical protein